MDNFTCLGSTISKDGRIDVSTPSYRRGWPRLAIISWLLDDCTKDSGVIAIHRVIVLMSTLLYGAETWTVYHT